MSLKNFSNISSWGLCNFDAKFDSALYNADLSWCYRHLAEFSSDIESSLLRHNKPISIRTVENLPLHWFIAGLQVNADTLFNRWLSCTSHGHEAFNEIFIFFGEGQGMPAHLVGSYVDILFWVELIPDLAIFALSGQLKWIVSYWWLDSVKPASLVRCTRHCEGCATQLFSH